MSKGSLGKGAFTTHHVIRSLFLLSQGRILFMTFCPSKMPPTIVSSILFIAFSRFHLTLLTGLGKRLLVSSGEKNNLCRSWSIARGSLPSSTF